MPPDQTTGEDTTEFPTVNFRVEEFRVPLMKAAIRLPSATLVRAATVAVDVSVEYLSGGPAKGLPVTLSSQVNTQASVDFPDFNQFTFANGAVKEGVVKNEEWEDTSAATPTGVHQRATLMLDAAGGARTSITDIPLPRPRFRCWPNLSIATPTAKGRRCPTR